MGNPNQYKTGKKKVGKNLSSNQSLTQSNCLQQQQQILSPLNSIDSVSPRTNKSDIQSDLDFFIKCGRGGNNKAPSVASNSNNAQGSPSDANGPPDSNNNGNNDGNNERRDNGKRNGDDEKKQNEYNQTQAANDSPSKRPIAVLESAVIDARHGWITFDASKSKDINGKSCTSFMFDFGDGTSPIVISSTFVTRSYRKSGIYKVSATVMDENNSWAQTTIQQRVDPPSSSLVTSPIPSVMKPPDTSKIENKKQQPSGYDQKSQKINSQMLPFSLTIQHDTNKNKKKKHSKHHVFNYDPPSSIKAKGNVWIKSNMRTKVIPSKADVGYIKDMFSYMDKLTALQWNQQDDIKSDIGDEKVLDYDFYEESGEKLYCLITRVDETLLSSRNYKWIMDKTLYKSSELKAKHIETPILRSKEDILSLFQNQQCVDKILKQSVTQKIQTISLSKISVYHRQNVKETDGIIWTLTTTKFREYCKNNQNWRCMPIVMSYDNLQDRFQYLITISTEPDKCDIGISVKYDSFNDSIYITGFHIDKQSILEQHQIAMPHNHNQTCDCLAAWNDDANIIRLTIVDPNDYEKLPKESADGNKTNDTFDTPIANNDTNDTNWSPTFSSRSPSSTSKSSQQPIYSFSSPQQSHKLSFTPTSNQ